LSSYSNSKHCSKVLEDFYKNFKTVKYISNKSNKTINISELNENTYELSLTKKLENYLSNNNNSQSQINQIKDNLNYNVYKDVMKHTSMNKQGYN